MARWRFAGTRAQNKSATVTANEFDVTPPDVAVILAVPTSSELINPLLDTVATRVSLDAHENATPWRILPDASMATACACRVCSRPIEDDDALTVIVATGGFTTVNTSAFDVT
jgi:hypothetical protein